MFNFIKKRIADKSTKEPVSLTTAPAFKTEHGYKATPMNMKCKDFQYKMGTNEYPEPDKISKCNSGLHYCTSIEDLAHYADISHSRIFEVVASTLQEDKTELEKGRYFTRYMGDSKKVAKSITITRELTEEEIYKAFEYTLVCKAIFDCETFVAVRNLSTLETENYIREKIVTTLISKGYSKALSNIIYEEIRKRKGICGKTLYYDALKYADLEISNDMRVYMLFYSKG